jgi:SAM-dependent methyltransferase
MDELELKNKIAKLAQFPHKQRKENYQSYYLNGEYIHGARNTLERMNIMNIPENIEGLSILDLGCNLGEIGNECYKRGASTVLGLDYEKDYIDCATELVKHNQYDITYHQKDLTKTKDCAMFINEFFNNRTINIVFALSLYKHIKGSLFDLLELISFDKCIIESNNAPDGLQTTHVQEMIKHIKNKKWNWKLIGTDNTRSPRMIFEVVKNG